MDEHIIQAYRATDYRVHSAEPFTLRIDEVCVECDALLEAFQAATAAYLTAWNPYSQGRSSAENTRAQEELAAELAVESIAVLAGEWVGPIGAWPPEPSLLALGISHHKAVRLAEKYQQKSFVWIEENPRPSSCSPFRTNNSLAAFDYQLVRRGILPKALKRGIPEMNKTSGLFTSESVSHGHPDKICDQISDAILDACLAQDPHSRVAVEVAIKGDLLCIFGELTSRAAIDAGAIARQVLRDIGHIGARWGVDADRIRIIEELSRQSPEIGARVDSADTGAGDQGLMFGFACNETPALMPLSVTLAHALMEKHWQLRQSDQWGKILGPDAKAQVTVRYAGGQPDSISSIVLSSQHAAKINLEELRALLRDEIIKPVLGPRFQQGIKLHLNPAGTFISGGPIADAGLTGRKIIVDTYGGMARHGGGAFSGKDCTKVDRSAAYAARQLARDVVERGWAETCEVRVAYAIGEARPVAVDFETFGTGCGAPPDQRYSEMGVDVSEALRPASIIERLRLRAPIFRQTAALGHFGREGLPWEGALFSPGTSAAITQSAIS